MAFSKSLIINERGGNVTLEEHNMVVDMAARCMKELSKREYEMPRFNRKVTVKTKYRDQRSYGGAEGISIDVSCLRKQRTFHREYDAYADCKLIGSYNCDDPKMVLLGIVAHEVAHHVQYRYAKSTRFKKTWRKPHGDCFRTLYRYLRVKFINEHVYQLEKNSGKIK
jgi:hypothetical protein